MRRIILALSLMVASAASAHGPVATGFSGGGGGTPATPPLPSFSEQNVSAAGLSSNPRGMVFIDLMTAFGSGPGGRGDVNGSMYGFDTGSGVCSGAGASQFCVDAETDYISDYGTYTFATSSVAWESNPSGAVPDAADVAICRDSTSPFPACSNTAVGTCATTVNYNRPETFIFKVAATGRYYPATMFDYDGCANVNPRYLQLIRGIPTSLGTSDTFQLASKDGIHQNPYMSYWMAQTLAEAKWEAFFYPKKNMLKNGDLETTCATAGNGWNLSTTYYPTAGSTTNMTQTSYSPTYNGSTAANAIYSKGCALSSSRAAGVGFTSDAITVQPYSWYQAHGYVSSAETGAGNGVTLDVLDDSAAPGASITAASGAGSDVKVWNFVGDYSAMTGTPPTATIATTPTRRQGVGWNYYIIKFYSGAQRTVRLTFRTAGGTGQMKIDHWYMSPAVVQNADLNNIFAPGVQKWSLDGDSRAVGPSSHWLPEALDAVFASSRPDITLRTTFLATNSATNGRPTTQSATYPLGALSYRPDFGLFWLGVNDVTSGIYGSVTRANWNLIRKSMENAGIVPVMFGEIPSYGNQPVTCADDSGSVICGIKLNNAMQLLFNALDVN